MVLTIDSTQHSDPDDYLQSEIDVHQWIGYCIVYLQPSIQFHLTLQYRGRDLEER